MSRARLLAYPNGVLADALDRDSWNNKHNVSVAASGLARRFWGVACDLWWLIDEPGLYDELRAAGLEVISYCQPLNCDPTKQYPVGRWRYRHQQLIKKRNALLPPASVGYNNCDLRKLGNDLVALCKEGPDVPRFCDTMNVPNGVDARDYEWRLLDFADKVSPYYMNTGGQWAERPYGPSGHFTERFPALTYDGTIAGLLVNPVNGLLSHPRKDPMIFVSGEKEMPSEGRTLQALAVALLCDAILVVGSSDGGPKEARLWEAPLPPIFSHDFGNWGAVQRPYTNTWVRADDRGNRVELNLSDTLQNIVRPDGNRYPILPGETRIVTR